METLTAKLGTGQHRLEIVSGKRYVVAPMTILSEGVLHGTEGPIFYPAETNTKYASVWNGVSIVLRHPMKNGKPVLATTPYVWTTSEVGKFFESKGTEDGRVIGEAWFGEDDLKRVDNSLYEHVIQNKPMDVSVGARVLWQDHAPKTYNSKPYARTAKYYSPDHIALLPDEKGACTQADGCGLFVANAFVTEDGVYKIGEDGQYVLNPALVQDEGIWEKAKKAVREGKKKYKGKRFWKVVASVYKKMGGRVGGMASTVHNNFAQGRQTLGNDIEVTPETVDRIKTNLDKALNEGQLKLVENKGDLKMEKDELVGWLVLNCDCWKAQGDKEVLNAMTVDKLKQLKINSEKAKETAVLVANARKELGIADNVSFIDGVKEKIKTTPTVKGTETVQTSGDKVVNNSAVVTDTKDRLTPEELEDISFARTEKNRQKAVLVERLIANVSGDDNRRSIGNRFMQKPLAELQELVSILPVNQQQQGLVNNSQFDFAKPIAGNMPYPPNGYGYPPGYGGNYALAGGGYVANNEPQPETLHDALPSWDWSEESETVTK